MEATAELAGTPGDFAVLAGKAGAIREDSKNPSKGHALQHLWTERKHLRVARLPLDRTSALVNGAAGVVVFSDGQPFSVIGFTIVGSKIVEIDILSDPERLRHLDLSVFDK